MQIVAPTLIVTAGVACLVGSALAADMTGAEIKTFVSGKTVVIKFGTHFLVPL